MLTPTDDHAGYRAGLRGQLPLTAWTTGQYVYIETTRRADYAFYWTGSAWAAVFRLVEPRSKPTTALEGRGQVGDRGLIPSQLTPVLSYLPFSVYSFFQNGGRFAWVIGPLGRAARQGHLDPTHCQRPDTGTVAPDCVHARARSVGDVGRHGQVRAAYQNTAAGTTEAQSVFALQILLTNAEGNDEVVETFPALSMTGHMPGTRRVDSVINDPFAGAATYVITGGQLNDLRRNRLTRPSPLRSDGGVDPGMPDAADLAVGRPDLVTKIDGPVTSTSLATATMPPRWTDRKRPRCTSAPRCPRPRSSTARTSS